MKIRWGDGRGGPDCSPAVAPRREPSTGARVAPDGRPRPEGDPGPADPAPLERKADDGFAAELEMLLDAKADAKPPPLVDAIRAWHKALGISDCV